MNKEDICRKCGKCCHKKTWKDGKIILLQTHCQHLDPETNLCTIYQDRFKLYNCLTIEQAIINKALPKDCPYVKDIKNYQGPENSL
jgi:uncharacterized protein